MAAGKGFDFSVKKVLKLFARPRALSKPHMTHKGTSMEKLRDVCQHEPVRGPCYMQKVSFTRLTAGQVSLRGKPKKFIPEIKRD